MLLAYEPGSLKLCLLAHADNHQVHVRLGGVAVVAAVLRNLVEGHGSVGDVDVGGIDVDVVQKLLVDTIVAALLMVGSDGIELVEAVDFHVAERYLAGLVATNELAVEAQRRLAGSEAEDEGGGDAVVGSGKGRGSLVGLDGGHNLVGHILHGFRFVAVDVGGNLLETTGDVGRDGIHDEAALAG